MDIIWLYRACLKSLQSISFFCFGISLQRHCTEAQYQSERSLFNAAKEDWESGDDDDKGSENQISSYRLNNSFCCLFMACCCFHLVLCCVRGPSFVVWLLVCFLV